MKHQFLLCICVLTLSFNVLGEILLTAPPIASKFEMEKSFGPLTKSLSKALDEKVSYIHQDNWLAYSRDVRAGIYDILLSEAHILSLSILSGDTSGGLGHVPITALEGRKNLFLVSNDERIQHTSQLNYKKICAKPSPSIDAVKLYTLYKNPVSQPNVIEIRGSYSDLILAMNNKRCIAVVIQKPPSEDSNLKLIHELPSIPQIGWTMTSRLRQDTRQLINDYYRAEENQVLISNAMSVVADLEGPLASKPFLVEDYKGFNKLLGNVWGW